MMQLQDNKQNIFCFKSGKSYWFSTGNPSATVYIIDNDDPAPVPSQQIELNYVALTHQN
jgi:hypothetical protein